MEKTSILATNKNNINRIFLMQNATSCGFKSSYETIHYIFCIRNN